VHLKGIARSERAYQVVHPSLRQEFPALRSLEATPNNLPQHLTSFIGREREIEEAEELLEHARLLTLLGIGGLGKTRLSQQIADDVLDSYRDGCVVRGSGAYTRPVHCGQRNGQGPGCARGARQTPHGNALCASEGAKFAANSRQL
jgi:hypothetical protein